MGKQWAVIAPDGSVTWVYQFWWADYLCFDLEDWEWGFIAELMALDDQALLYATEDVKPSALGFWRFEAKSGVIWSEALVVAARECAAEAVRRMAAGVFWPPAEDVAHDEFEDLLLEDARELTFQRSLERTSNRQMPWRLELTSVSVLKRCNFKASRSGAIQSASSL